MRLEEFLTFAKRVNEQNYASEQAVSQGVVLPLLSILGWDVFDPSVVVPEYKFEDYNRVDFALLNRSKTPRVFIEVKGPGNLLKAENQLAGYLTKYLAPLAIYTDGREWRFFAPTVEGSFNDRHLRSIDLNGNLEEAFEVFTNYLSRENVNRDDFKLKIESDYANLKIGEDARERIPEAWNNLVVSKDEMLIGLIQEEVGKLAGHQPKTRDVVSFLESTKVSTAMYVKSPQKRLKAAVEPPVTSTNYVSSNHIVDESATGELDMLSRKVSLQKISSDTTTTNNETSMGKFYYVLFGRQVHCKDAIDVIRQLLIDIDALDSKFLHRLDNLPKHGSKRRYVSSRPDNLFPKSFSSASKYVEELEQKPGWYFGKDVSTSEVVERIKFLLQHTQIEEGINLQVIIKGKREI